METRVDIEPSRESTVGRCSWSEISERMRHYHDTEWGVPQRDDRRLFEYLVLDTFQAGLSWSIILNKREGFHEAFRGFDPEAVAMMTAKDVDDLCSSPLIIRNRAKIEATVGNATTFLQVAQEFGSFSRYFWRFVNDRPVQNRWVAESEIPAQTEESLGMSKDLRKRGFRFVGPTICYAIMQSAGLVNDHVVSCFRHAQVAHAIERFSDT